MKSKLLVFILFSTLFVSCSPAVDEKNDTKKEAVQKQSPTPKYSYKIIYHEESGWGYQLFEGSKLIIEQKHIPAIQGVQGFDTRDKADRAAHFVVGKLENGIFPPTISKEELDSLGVLPKQ